MKLPEDLQALAAVLKKLPGVGSKTAERFAFELIGWAHHDLLRFSSLLATIQEKIPPCPVCGCLTQEGHCPFCSSTSRDSHSLCILASARDVYAIEETRSFNGLYHVIEYLLSPLDGRHAEELGVERIENRILRHDVQEVVIAFDSTLEGDATALYLKERLAPTKIKITRLAFGMPVGSSLDHIDGGTLMRALAGRQSL